MDAYEREEELLEKAQELRISIEEAEAEGMDTEDLEDELAQVEEALDELQPDLMMENTRQEAEDEACWRYDRL